MGSDARKPGCQSGGWWWWCDEDFDHSLFASRNRDFDCLWSCLISGAVWDVVFGWVLWSVFVGVLRDYNNMYGWVIPVVMTMCDFLGIYREWSAVSWFLNLNRDVEELGVSVFLKCFFSWLTHLRFTSIKSLWLCFLLGGFSNVGNFNSIKVCHENGRAFQTVSDALTAPVCSSLDNARFSTLMTRDDLTAIQPPVIFTCKSVKSTFLVDSMALESHQRFCC